MRWAATALAVSTLASATTGLRAEDLRPAAAATEVARAAEPALILELPESLAARRQELAATVAAAVERVRSFARTQGWEGLATESFLDRVRIFDRKREFDSALLTAAGEDPETPLPATYCAALERRVLMAVAPALYAEAYPEGVEPASYEKLLAHEIAHRLHVRVLGGNEEAMGPIWFYEGFAIFVADQLRQARFELTPEQIWQVVGDPERGSYAQYGYVFRHFAARAPLQVLVSRAGEPGFAGWLRALEESVGRPAVP